MKKTNRASVARLLAFALALFALVSLTGFLRPVSSAIAEAEPTASADEKPDPGAAADVGSTVTTGEAEQNDEKPDPDNATEAGDTAATGESAEAGEEAKVEFVLFEKLKKVDTKGWILFGAALALSAVIIVFLATRRKADQPIPVEKKVSPTIILVHGALCIALSFVLSYIKLFSMPAGGSITIASMLPLMIYANRYGVRNGLLAGLVCGILQYIQESYFVHWIQFIFDYPLAFALIGLAGITRGENNLVFSVLIGGTARFLSHFIGGVLFFGEFVMIGKGAEVGMSLSQMLPANISVSFTYNAPYMFADIAICAIIALIPAFRTAIKRSLKY